jgi:L-seryl-tRNA(Ser) seleniumtransferase
MSPPHDLHLQFRIYQMHVSRFTRYAHTCAADAAGQGERLRSKLPPGDERLAKDSAELGMTVKAAMENKPENLYRRLPQLGAFLDGAAARELLERFPRELVADAARRVLLRLRKEIEDEVVTTPLLDRKLERLGEAVVAELHDTLQPSLRAVINATGVILQTNLGRAPLSRAALQHIEEVAGGYCNLELDLDTGERSRRDIHIEKLIPRVLTVLAGKHGDVFAESRAALVVNNCAAATFLALNSLAEGGEVIVSRGELVEIGGGFRIPEILRKSGAILREVGTTNRTRLADYASAITPQTRLILRVHRSNFRLEGFTERPSIHALVELGAQNSIPVFEDQGTGCVARLDQYGIADESCWLDSATAGLALVAVSGDKLLGGPQCGILVGERELIEGMRENPLYRTYRVDKLTYAALEATLLAYLNGTEDSIPAIGMLARTAEAIQQRCESLAAAVCSLSLTTEVVPTRSVVGGGTTPGASLPSFAVALHHAEMNEHALASRLRRLDPPVVSRVANQRVLLDLRTVAEESDATLIALLQKEFGRERRRETAAVV